MAGWTTSLPRVRTSTAKFRAVDIGKVRSISQNARWRFFGIPAVPSSRHSLSLLIAGFLVEGGTEVYQFIERGNLSQGWIEYYASLGTTILGFYLMFLGLREWTASHQRAARVPHPPSGPGRPWSALALWAAGTVTTAALDLAFPNLGPDAAPAWIAWPVGGLVVLGFGDFFLKLRSIARTIGPRLGDALGSIAFLWSLGVATLAGLLVGERVVALLTEFVTDWGRLVVSLAPVVIAISPLAVTYGLLSVAFLLARNNSPRPTT
jgi:hypothetical protein